jgi:GT2 family glycosyltransferase
MISIITCSREPPSTYLHERNVRKTATGPIEYIRMDNRERRYGLCAAYNLGVQKARGDILVFVHEDAFFMESGWDAVLAKKFTDTTLGLVGIAGTQFLFPDPPGWVVAGRPFIRGKVVHETHGGDRFHLTVFSWDESDVEVVAVDGLFFAIRRRLFDDIRFDEATFDGFHFYDLDICMQVRRTHRCIVTSEILITHRSGGAFDETWRKYAQRFTTKYKAELPVSCVAEVPDLSKRFPFENFDLKGKASQVTIA